ncbi:hypothetical protein BDP27DRAFT_1344272 [Rhodocollybia butyracea]|uniref:Glycosyltransferase family 25 protein n=1 Tax=Rhodocollybia butyracea TaxID=206335 RepID=A0A9P5P829_9AGAR|nr:hypothetical protein BDP27DRAFT_1344272 [Rhodocollybia butyracea]
MTRAVRLLNRRQLFGFAAFLSLLLTISTITCFNSDVLPFRSTKKPWSIDLVGSGPLIPRNSTSESIYVISLPHRTDRRERMEILRNYLGLNWTYVEATSVKDEIVARILGNVKKLREESMRARLELLRIQDAKVKERKNTEAALKTSADEFALFPDDLEPNPNSKLTSGLFSGVKLPFEWPLDLSQQPSPVASLHSPFRTQILSFLAKFDVYSNESSGFLRTWSPLSRLSSNSTDEDEYFSRFLSNRPALPISTKSISSSPSLELVGATRDFSLAPYSSTFPYQKFLTLARVAVWYSHLSVLRQIHKIQAESRFPDEHISVILEDDINVEKDIRNRLGGIWQVLPQDWDVVFLGHCWSNESFYPAIISPSNRPPSSNTRVFDIPQNMNTLHSSSAPRCTHAYALSAGGATRLLAHLEYPPFAYSRAIDQAYAWLVINGRIKAYSIVGSVVVQTKAESWLGKLGKFMGGGGVEVGKGDVWRDGDGTSSSTWKEDLVDGVFVFD